MNDTDLHSLTAPYLHIFVASVSEVTNFGLTLANLPSAKVVVRFLRGSKMKLVSDLFDEFSAALQFPYYFGENWNAFDECITDLSWLSGDSYILVVTDAEQLLMKDEPDQLESIIHLLQDAGDEWSGNGKSFHVVFQCSEKYRQEMTHKITSAKALLGEVKAN